MIRIFKETLVGKLAAVLLATGMMVTSLLLAANPGHADTTFTVTNTSDGGTGSLRQAILDANTTLGADTIRFNIPGPSEVKTLVPTSQLPTITDSVTIDGYTQPGSSPNTLAKGTNAKLMVELNGFDAGDVGLSFTHGLDVAASDTVIKGLAINRFSANGVEVQSDVPGVRLEGNFIGTDPTGTSDRGNHVEGVHIGAGDTPITVGGTTPAARNLISGNDFDGIGSRSEDTRVLGNLIGTKKDGTTALGNARKGVSFVSSSDSAVGDGTAAAANTIAFNGEEGIEIVEDASLGPGTANGNRILRNSIFSNEGLGIDLQFDGPTANDGAGDADIGPNRLQNKPVLTSAKTASGKTTIQGNLNSSPNTLFTVQFFSNPSGNEGKRFLGQKSVTTLGNGNTSFVFKPATPVGVGQAVTATATRNFTSDTSEFSAARKVVKAS